MKTYAAFLILSNGHTKQIGNYLTRDAASRAIEIRSKRYKNPQAKIVAQ